ncbi:MAG TPA: methyltransferase domain-containing protein [Candidatus Limnocylindrales bacterium]
MVTVGRRAYDLMYRFGAPWEGADRPEIKALVADGRCAPETLRRPGEAAARAIDLGCGSGATTLWLAEAGFTVTGVDFSPVALRKARAAAASHGIGDERVSFVHGDLTAGHVDGVVGPFDLLVDYGTLDDLPEDGRAAMASYVTSLARPGSRLFLFAFSGAPADLPRLSFGGPSRAFPGLLPGEVERRFGEAFTIDVLEAPTRSRHMGTWLMERLPDRDDGLVDATAAKA